MKALGWVVALCALFFVTAPASASTVVAKIDISSQRMTVCVNGVPRYNWLVSTARRGYYTPTGSFSAKWLDPNHRSSKYENAPMPHSVFFHGGFAVHGTYAVGSLGRAVSHGCVRLAPGNAATLYSLVRANMGSSRIVISC